MGHVAMATDHGGWPTMPTGDAGSLIRGRSSETQEEAVTGAWTSTRWTRRHRVLAEPTKRENWARDFTVRLQLNVLRKVLRAASLHIVGWIRHFRWSLLQV